MHERIFNVSAGAEFLLSNSMTGFALNFSLKEVYDCMTTSPCFVGEYSTRVMKIQQRLMRSRVSLRDPGHKVRCRHARYVRSQGRVCHQQKLFLIPKKGQGYIMLGGGVIHIFRIFTPANWK